MSAPPLMLMEEGWPQETIGEVMQLDVENIDVHPYHHHTQPYQIVALENDTAAMDASWRVRHAPHIFCLLPYPHTCMHARVLGAFDGMHAHPGRECCSCSAGFSFAAEPAVAAMTACD